MSNSVRPKSFYSGLGITAILLWSMSIALNRSVIEKLGVLTTAMCVYSLGGFAGLGVKEKKNSE
jgi:hypothetical protein